MHTPAGTAAPALVRALGRARRRVRAWWEARTVRFRKVTRTVDDHQLTIPMAKELCMIQRNERGKQARQYFLAVEA